MKINRPMSPETKRVIIIIFVAVVLFAFFWVSIQGQKTDCLASGGKWVEGYIGGSYSAFCIPK
jgi:preprotein translocase subunit SecY